jgi:hypothetical protein
MLLYKEPTWLAVGATSRSISSRLPTISKPASELIPVIFPSGRARFCGGGMSGSPNYATSCSMPTTWSSGSANELLTDFLQPGRQGCDRDRFQLKPLLDLCRRGWVAPRDNGPRHARDAAPRRCQPQCSDRPACRHASPTPANVADAGPDRRRHSRTTTPRSAGRRWSAGRGLVDLLNRRELLSTRSGANRVWCTRSCTSLRRRCCLAAG